ncbi:AAA family ATPase [Saccharicrinis sp. FJH54]|uniref:AAA family ATPase n=1 Tax=Saccharicrinis sp. FJH54 TaxID=3344665 RepID=UPI0035D4F452
MDEEKKFEERIGLQSLQEKVLALKKEIAKVLVGKEDIVDLIVVAILADGHILLEGVPGIAKTMIAKLMARLLSVGYSRIQFTPDLMPSDVTGTTIFNSATSKFEFNEGPVFSNLVLIDEINRAPAKTQASLFEVMEERQVTVDGKTYKMKSPFVVIATQNPLEHEGTYRLPEAQLDRFMFKILVDYPSAEEEFMILQNMHQRKGEPELKDVKTVLTAKDLATFRKQVQEVTVDDNLMKYIAEIVIKTRNHPSLYLGASPRASIHAMNAAKAYAAINGRDYVIPEDVKAVFEPILLHRIYLTPEKELEGIFEDKVVKDIIKTVEVPR